MSGVCASVDVGLNTCLDSSVFGFGIFIIVVPRNVVEYYLTKGKGHDDCNMKHSNDY